MKVSEKESVFSDFILFVLWILWRVICRWSFKDILICTLREKFKLFYHWVMLLHTICVIFSSVQLLSLVRLFVTPWIAAHQASLSITNSRSSLRLTSIESVMPSSHLILSRPLLLLPPVPPSVRVFSNESTLRMSWPKYWSFSFSISPSNVIDVSKYYGAVLV